ncbi:MAG: hypothetical protein K6A71_03125 [Lachnospiraceae bacterium]|nr:hypothetical protein [Lachnospiraceae bacterium]
MKRIIATILCGITILSTTTNVFAADLSNISNISSAAASGAVAGESAYVTSVVQRMAGRCGATAPTGAKGVAFELTYSDLNNAKSFVKGDTLKTVLTKSPNATVNDALIIDTSTGKIASRIQLKNTTSTSGVRDTIKRVASGQYNSAKLVGTTEAAEAYNNAALKKGISKKMIDSGISEEFTKRIADEALGNVSKAASVAKSVGKATEISMVITGGLALVESGINGDDAYHTMANVATDVGTAAAVTAPAELIGIGAKDALVAMGASGGGYAAVPFIVVVGTSIIGFNIVEGYIDEDNIKEIVANHIQNACEETAGFACYIGDQIGEGLEATANTLSTIPSVIEDTCVTSAEAVCLAEERISEHVENADIPGKASTITGSVAGAFNDAGKAIGGAVSKTTGLFANK